MLILYDLNCFKRTEIISVPFSAAIIRNGSLWRFISAAFFNRGIKVTALLDDTEVKTTSASNMDINASYDVLWKAIYSEISILSLLLLKKDILYFLREFKDLIKSILLSIKTTEYPHFMHSLARNPLPVFPDPIITIFILVNS
jgi:hypothetical protein